MNDVRTKQDGSTQGELCDEQLESVAGGAIYMDLGDFPGEATAGTDRESFAALLPYIEQENITRKR